MRSSEKQDVSCVSLLKKVMLVDHVKAPEVNCEFYLRYYLSPSVKSLLLLDGIVLLSGGLQSLIPTFEDLGLAGLEVEDAIATQDFEVYMFVGKVGVNFHLGLSKIEYSLGMFLVHKLVQVFPVLQLVLEEHEVTLLPTHH